MPMIDLVDSAALIERDSMAEIADCGICICERECMRNHPDGANCVPA
jgi:hypothetical protein